MTWSPRFILRHRQYFGHFIEVDIPPDVKHAPEGRFIVAFMSREDGQMVKQTMLAAQDQFSNFLESFEIVQINNGVWGRQRLLLQKAGIIGVMVIRPEIEMPIYAMLNDLI